MFSKQNEHTTFKVDTIIGKNFIYKGILETPEGSLRIDGKFEGELRIGGNLFVGETGVVNGLVIAKNVIISGQVNGKIEAHGKLELKQSAKVLADARMLFLSIEDGAFFKGLSEPQSNEDVKKHSKEKIIDTNFVNQEK